MSAVPKIVGDTQPDFQPGEILWCLSGISYDMRKFERCVQYSTGKWYAVVQGRHVGVPSEDCYRDREQAHKALIARWEDKYKRAEHRARQLRMKLDGIRKTVNDHPRFCQ